MGSHGRGGGRLAALAVAEKENEIRDPNYLGAIAISDVAGVKEIFTGPARFL